MKKDSRNSVRNMGQNLGHVIGAWQKKRILVVGDLGLDRYTLGVVERISPEAPVPIVRVEEESLKLGLASNVADNIQALGGKARIVGVIGQDAAGSLLCAVMQQSGIDPKNLVREKSYRTILKERIVSDRQQLLRVDYENPEALTEKMREKVLANVEKLLPTSDAVILQDYSKGLLTPSFCARLFALVGRHGKWVAVDPNSKGKLELYRGAYLMTPNTREAESLTGITIRDSESLEKAGRMLQEKTGAERVVITRGKEGMALFDGTKKRSLIPTYAQEVYDVSGAGDTVISVMTLALTSGANLVDAATLGNLAAGVEVGKRGTATVSIKEIKAAMKAQGMK